MSSVKGCQAKNGINQRHGISRVSMSLNEIGSIPLSHTDESLRGANWAGKQQRIIYHSKQEMRKHDRRHCIVHTATNISPLVSRSISSNSSTRKTLFASSALRKGKIYFRAKRIHSWSFPHATSVKAPPSVLGG